MVSLLAYVSLACREELAFHGYPLRRSQRILGLWSAQLLIAIVFAGEHVAGGWTWENALLGAGVGSLLFGMASIATEGLAVPIGLHAAYNFCDLLRGGKGSGGVWMEVVASGSPARAQTVAMAAYVALMSLSTLAFWFWHSRRRLRI